MTNLRFRQAVFIVTYAKTDEGIKYLVLKRRFHWCGWEFTKGGIDKGETRRETVFREVMEETGKKAFNVKNFRIFGRYKYKKKFPERKGIIGQSYVLFSAEIEYGKIKIDEKEHSTYEWLNFDEAMRRLTHLNQKKCLRIVNNWLIKIK